MINRSTVYSESYVYCSLIKKLFSLIVIFWIAEVYEPPKIKKNKTLSTNLEPGTLNGGDNGPTLTMSLTFCCASGNVYNYNSEGEPENGI